MAKKAVLAVEIVSEAAGAVSGLDKVGGKLGGLGKFAAVGAAAVGAAALAVGKFAIDAMKSASDLEQSIGAVDTVFKSSAGQIHDWAKSAANDVGLTRNQYSELGTLIGTQLKNGGTAMEELGGKTNDLIKLGADLSSMFGGTTADAVGALSSALKGERDPIEKYGVSLTQAAIDAEAASLGFQKVGGSLSAEANQAATLSLIMKQTADAHGNFAKESDTAAGKQQRFTAQLQNFQDRIGMVLLPIMTAFFGLLNEVMPAIEGLVAGFEEAGLGGVDMSSALQQLQPVIDALLQAAGPLWENLKTAAKTILPPLQKAFASIGGYVQTVASVVLPPLLKVLNALIPPVSDLVAQVLNFASALYDFLQPAIEALAPIVTAAFEVIGNTVGNVIGVISGILGTFTALLRGDWSGAWKAIQQTAVAAGEMMKDGLENVFKLIWGIISSIWQRITGSTALTWQQLKDTVMNGIHGAANYVKNGAAQILTWIANIPTGIRNKLGNLGNLLLGAGRAIIDGFLRGLKQVWEDVKGFVGQIGGWIAANKGPLSYDRRLLEPAGRAIMDGLIAALRAGMPELGRILSQITGEVAGVEFDPWRIPQLLGGSPAALPVAGRDVTVKIDVTVAPGGSPVDTGRAIVEAIEEYLRGGGRPAW